MQIAEGNQFLNRREELLRYYIDLNRHKEEPLEIVSDDITDDDIAASAGTSGLDKLIAEEALNMFRDPTFYKETSSLAIIEDREKDIEEYLNNSLNQPATVSMQNQKEPVDPMTFISSVCDTLSINPEEIIKPKDTRTKDLEQNTIDEVISTHVGLTVFTISCDEELQEVIIDPNKMLEDERFEKPVTNPRFSLPLQIEENPYKSEGYKNKTNCSQKWLYGDEEPDKPKQEEKQDPGLTWPWYLSKIKFQNHLLN